jgi:hypothetical protein
VDENVAQRTYSNVAPGVFNNFDRTMFEKKNVAVLGSRIARF